MSTVPPPAEIKNRYAYLVPVGCLIIVGALLGLTANVARLAISAGWHPVSFLFWSALGAGGLLLLASARVRQLPGRTKNHIRYYVVAGMLSFALPNALAFAAIPHVGVSFVALCLAFPPLLTYGLALTLKMDMFVPLKVAGLLAGLAGAALLAVSKGVTNMAELNWIGLAMVGPVVIALGNIYRTLRWPPNASAISLAPGMLLGGAVLLAAYAQAYSLPILPQPFTADQTGLLAGQILIFAVTYTLYFVLQRLAGPVYMSQIGWVGAIFGAGMAVWLLGEAATPTLGLVLALIILGILLVSRSR